MARDAIHTVHTCWKPFGIWCLAQGHFDMQAGTEPPIFLLIHSCKHIPDHTYLSIIVPLMLHYLFIPFYYA